MRRRSGLSGLATSQLHTVVPAWPPPLVGCAPIVHLDESTLLTSCPGQDEGESFLSTWSQLVETVIIFGVIFVMDCKCSLWTMWASCQFLPLLAQLDRVKHPRWSFYVGIRSFGRTAMVVAFKCFLRKRCGFACNSQTHFPSHAEQLKRHLLSVSKGSCYGKSSEEAKIPLNWMQT